MPFRFERTSFRDGDNDGLSGRLPRRPEFSFSDNNRTFASRDIVISSAVDQRSSAVQKSAIQTLAEPESQTSQLRKASVRGDKAKVLNKNNKNLAVVVLMLLVMLLLPFETRLAQAATTATPAQTDAVQAAQNWFNLQRAVPQATIPPNALSQALQQRQNVPSFTPEIDKLRPNTAAVWTALGPAPTNTAGGVSTGPYGTVSGQVTALAYDAPAHIIYAGTANGGVWKSSDGGNTWAALTDSQSSLAISAITLDPANPQIIYAGTGTLNYYRTPATNYYNVGILKSTDGGVTWTTLGQSVFGNHSNTKVTFISKIVVDPNSPTNTRHLLVATDAGLYLSSDNGNSFNPVLTSNSGNAVISDLVLDNRTNPSTITAAWGFPSGDAGNGLYRSADGGATFAPFGSGYPTGTRVGRISLAQAPSNLQQFYLVASDPLRNSSLGMWASNNNGVNWTQVSAAKQSGGPDLLGDDFSYREQGGY